MSHVDVLECEIARLQQEVVFYSNMLSPPAKSIKAMQTHTTTPTVSLNRFTILDIESMNTTTAATNKVPLVPPSPPLPWHHIPKWEHKLPKCYVIAAMPSPCSLDLKIELQTMDTGEVFPMDMLLDCGAMGLFIDTEYVCKNWLTMRSLVCPILVYNVDRSPKEAGAISGIIDLVLHYNSHTERVQFIITSLRKQNLILGYTWLCEHNLEIDWQTNKFKMSCCPVKCCTCTNKEKEKQHKKCKEVHHIQVCCAGPIPSMDNNLQVVPQSVQDSNEEDAPMDADDCAI